MSNPPTPPALNIDALRAAAALEPIDFDQAHTDAEHLKNYSTGGFLPPPTLLARAGGLLEALATVADPPTVLALLDEVERLREEVAARKDLCAAYRAHDYKLADRALTRLDRLHAALEPPQERPSHAD